MNAGSDFIVPPRRWAEIGGIANNLRHRLGLAEEPHLPVIELIERVLDRNSGSSAWRWATATRWMARRG
jgi:hypothetical protein